jgi:hypothetical protein
VWTEALRFLCAKVGVVGLNTPADVARLVTQYCHSSHGLLYDIVSGGAAFVTGGSGGTFQLMNYITGASHMVNCYDQAAAVQSLSGAVGVKMNWLYLSPYGFINTTNLVGVGSCNNPFYWETNEPILDPEDPQRTPFGNHAFCGLGGKIFDACAGPHGGTEDAAEYCRASIDRTTTLYRLHGTLRPGTAADIKTRGGVTTVV